MDALTNSFFVKIEEIFQKKLPKKIAVAVSGGADSLALTLLLDDFCRTKKIKLFAITVDHKMRQASSKEALELGEILAKRKIPHEILTISAAKIPQKNIEAKLREMRYELFLKFCQKNKIEFLFLGHHLGDVAENFLIRLFRGSGLDGLSTMKEVVSRKSLVVSQENLENLRDETEIEIIKKIANFPRIIEMAAVNFEPHRIAFYLQELAAEFHAWWNKGSENPELKFIIKDNLQLTQARISLVLAVQKIIAEGLGIFNIKPVEEMR